MKIRTDQLVSENQLVTFCRTAAALLPSASNFFKKSKTFQNLNWKKLEKLVQEKMMKQIAPIAEKIPHLVKFGRVKGQNRGKDAFENSNDKGRLLLVER